MDMWDRLFELLVNWVEWLELALHSPAGDTVVDNVGNAGQCDLEDSWLLQAVASLHYLVSKHKSSLETQKLDASNSTKLFAHT